jgi:hypothetical protein
MKVMIEVNDNEQAIEMLKAGRYVAFLEEFLTYIQGPGRETSGNDLVDKVKALALTHGIYVV